MIAYIPRDNYATNGFYELANFGNHLGIFFIAAGSRSHYSAVQVGAASSRDE